MITLSISSAVIYKSNPFKNKALFWTILMNEITYSIFMLIFLTILIFAYSMEFAQRYAIFGYSLIVLIASSLLFNFSIGIIEMGGFVKERCKKKPESKNTEKSKNPEIKAMGKQATKSTSKDTLVSPI